MGNKKMFFIMVALFAMPCYRGVSAAVAETVAPLTAQAAVAQAVAANPRLAQRRAEAEARTAIPAQAGTLPDPTLTLEPGRAAMNQFKVGIVQPLPYPGKLDLQREIARHEAEAATLEAGETLLQLTAQVRQAWWQLFYLDRALQTLHHSKDLLRQLVNVAESRYRVGAGLQQDVLRAQLGLSRLLAEEVELVGQRRSAEARLDALLYWPVTTAVILPAEVAETLPELPAEAELQGRAAQRPMLLARQRDIEAARSQRALARTDYRPDFMVGANYEWRNGEPDMQGVMFSMTLPLHTATRQDRAVDQRDAELMAQRLALQQAQMQVAAEVAAAAADYQRSREQARLLKNAVIPQATQTVTSMRVGYQVGKVDFFNLSDAQMMLYDYQTRYWRAVSEAGSAWAQLVAAVGQEVVDE
ncbi:MAG: TolC family protein [Gammaproteobacteria bacterium]|nr:TolC family protein [Gammaproteobacteria bacterium]